MEITIEGETLAFKDGKVNASAQGTNIKVQTSLAEVRVGDGEVFTK